MRIVNCKALSVHAFKMQKINNLYDNLMILTATYPRFMWVDKKTPNNKDVRIFSQHGAKGVMWEMPGATECNGIMFEMSNERPIKILCRPMEKFFEHIPCYTDTIETVMTKHDGIRISTFCDGDKLGLKTKLYFDKDQVIDTERIMSLELHEAVKNMAISGYTCDFEYVSPEHIVVLPYKQPRLFLLNIRHNISGINIPHKQITSMPIIRDYLVTNNFHDLSKVANTIDVRGLVYITHAGIRFHVTSEWYRGRRHDKHLLSSPSRICKYVIDGLAPAILSIFENDKTLCDRIIKCRDMYKSYSTNIMSQVFSIMKEVDDMTTIQIIDVMKTKPMELFHYIMKAESTRNPYLVLEMVNKNFKREYLKII